MSISAQLPSVPATLLRELAQQAGRTVEAKVLGQLPNGTTEVQIGRQVLSLQLPSLATAIGSTLTLAVQQAEGQVSVTLVATKSPPQPTASTPAPAPQPAATQVQISPAALASPPPRTLPLPPSTISPASATAEPPAPISSPPQAISTPQPQSPNPRSAATTPLPSQPVMNTAPSPTPTAPPPAPAAVTPNAVAPPTTAAGSAVAPAPRPVPYAPASPAPVTTAAPAAVTAAPPAIPQAAPITPSTPVTTNTPGPQPPAPAAAPATSPLPATPQLALSRMVQQALPRQDSIVGLVTALTSIAGRVSLPEPVAKAAQQVLANRLPLDARLDGKAIKTAVLLSGVFQEALLTAGQGKPAATDLKSSLLGLRQALGAWLGDQSEIQRAGSVPPPLKGQIPRARIPDMPQPDLPEDPVEAGKILSERTDAALSRLRLHQAASLPDPVATRQEAQWSMDLPVTVAGQQTILQLQIHGDPEGDTGRPEDRGWQVRFAINLSALGEVGAQISLRSKTVGVLLWSDKPETAEALAARIDTLRDGLTSVGLLPGAMIVRAGAPPPPARPDSHHILDETR
jgi:hypothetical protein